MNYEQHVLNYRNKKYRVQYYFGDGIWLTWLSYKKGRSALDAIRDIRNNNKHLKFRIKIQ